MKQILSVRRKTLYILWTMLFAATAVLGLAFPAAEGLGKAALMLLSIAFFVPPALLVYQAKHGGEAEDVKVVRLLSAVSLVLTTVLLVLIIRSVPYGEAVGDTLHVILAIVSAPMVCSNYYALPLFGWACLLFSTFSMRK